MNRIILFAAGFLVLSGLAEAAQIDWSAVDQAIGRPGSEQPGALDRIDVKRGS